MLGVPLVQLRAHRLRERLVRRVAHQDVPEGLDLAVLGPTAAQQVAAGQGAEEVAHRRPIGGGVCAREHDGVVLGELESDHRDPLGQVRSRRGSRSSRAASSAATVGGTSAIGQVAGERPDRRRSRPRRPRSTRWVATSSTNRGLPPAHGSPPRRPPGDTGPRAGSPSERAVCSVVNGSSPKLTEFSEPRPSPGRLSSSSGRAWQTSSSGRSRISSRTRSEQLRAGSARPSAGRRP